MLDGGYDVSSFTDVDPVFGTLGDFDMLLRKAHERGENCYTQVFCAVSLDYLTKHIIITDSSMFWAHIYFFMYVRNV